MTFKQAEGHRKSAHEGWEKNHSRRTSRILGEMWIVPERGGRVKEAVSSNGAEEGRQQVPGRGLARKKLNPA